jgi:hypothetical protein
VTEINKYKTDEAGIGGGNALQLFQNHDGIYWRRVDITHELDKGIKMQYRFNSRNFFKGYSHVNNGTSMENYVGSYTGAAWTAPANKAYITPFMMLQYVGTETLSETYKLHCQIEIVYDTVWTDLRDVIKIDTSTHNEAIA